MIVVFLLLQLSSAILGYNIDSRHPVIHAEPENSRSNDSYFGYTVQLCTLVNLVPGLLIGAPRGQLQDDKAEKPGVLYFCITTLEYNHCTQTIVRPNVVGYERTYAKELFGEVTIKTSHGWFGAALSVVQNKIIVCAPRTIVTINNYVVGYPYFDTMHGLCYAASTSENKFGPILQDISYYEYRAPFWWHPLRGFSVQLAPVQNFTDGNRLDNVIGEPNHSIYGTVTISHNKKRKLLEIKDNEDAAKLGYSVSVGYYFDRSHKRYWYASGAPGWQFNGMVVVTNPFLTSNITTYVSGKKYGEFFGASLTSCDVDNDGLDELIVGAPHWGLDQGRVYIFFADDDLNSEKFETFLTVDGTVEGGLFGYSVTCGDLDADDNSDIVVGAPWEGSGAIYIFNGDSNLRDKYKLESTQIIRAEQLSDELRTFGFSLSEPKDINKDGYLDLGVGAYKSGHAVVLWSKKVLKTHLTIDIKPGILLRNITSFNLETCVKYSSNRNFSDQGYKLTIAIDEIYKRTKNTTILYSSSTIDQKSCFVHEIELLKNIDNFIDPINVYVKHEFIEISAKVSDHCKNCPVEDGGSSSSTAWASVLFDIGCGKDELCNSHLSAGVKFHGTLENNTWIIGSNDISIEITVKNIEEPAYFLTVQLDLPTNISLLSISPSCQEEKLNSSSTISCLVANPLNRNEERSIILDLDMKNMNNGNFHDRIIEFPMKLLTKSENNGIKSLTTSILLKSDAYLTINGKANEEKYYYSMNENEKLNISFQHVFQILKFGKTPIKNAQLRIQIPMGIQGVDPILYLYEPQVYISGKFYKCSSDILEFLKVKLPNNEEKKNQRDFNNIATNSNDSYYNQTFEINSEVDRTLNRTIRNLQRNTFFIDRRLPNLYVHNSKQNNEIEESNILYLNCSSSYIKCSNITCDLSALKTTQNVGKMIIKFIIDINKIKENELQKIKIIKFISDAYVSIIEPVHFLNNTDNSSTLKLTTTFYNNTSEHRVNIIVILVSVFLSLIVLCIFILLLSMFGFFKRTKMEELNALKTNEEIMNVEDVVDLNAK